METVAIANGIRAGRRYLVGGNTVWLAFGSALATLLRDPTRARVANIGFAVLLLVSVFAKLVAG